jgi:hypothetical protein
MAELPAVPNETMVKLWADVQNGVEKNQTGEMKRRELSSLL